YEEQWRPAAATLLVVVALLVTAYPRSWRRALAPAWAVVLAAFLALLWGGLPLTVLLTLVGMTASIPLGIVLALARRSNLPFARGAAAVYIELVRGVPLITVLFVASFVFP